LGARHSGETVMTNEFKTVPDGGALSQPLASELAKAGTPASAIRTQPKGTGKPRRDLRHKGQFVLVLQGGGALGAYQVGVYQALHEAGVEPDWVIGTSIGAINASLIAGNKPAERLEKLLAFWSRIEHGALAQAWARTPLIGAAMSNLITMTQGLPAFFQPNPRGFWDVNAPLGPEHAGYYSTAPLAATLSDLVDFALINDGGPRLTVGAANVQTAEMRYFDSRDERLDIRHVLASGALPPAFPAVRIDGELFWDGGILSNTPVEAVFDDRPRRDALVFSVHIWNPHGPEPDTIWQVLNRQKDIQYSSRSASHIARQKQMHRLRHVIAELGKLLPEATREQAAVRELTAYGCRTHMHVVRLLSPSLDGEDHTKDIDFSAKGIAARREAGYRDTKEVLERAPWDGEFDPVEGFILHEARTGTVVTAA
jgi:NTE family protein